MSSPQVMDAPAGVEEFCGARTRSGRPCRRRAGAGTDHLGYGRCSLHLGSTRTGRVHAAREEAKAAAVVMGAPLDIDPHEALLHCIRITAGEVAYATAMVGDLDVDQAVDELVTTSTRSTADGTTTEETRRPKELHVWIRVRQDAVDRLARYSKMALDAGVAERQVRLAERYGTSIARLLGGVLEGLELSPEQQARAPEVVRRAMVLLEAGGGE